MTCVHLPHRKPPNPTFQIIQMSILKKQAGLGVFPVVFFSFFLTALGRLAIKNTIGSPLSLFVKSKAAASFRVH